MHSRTTLAGAGPAWTGLAAALFLFPPPACADEATLQQVVVSARRVSERPQQIPMSVDVFTDDSLRREDIRTSTSLQDKVPGLAICCANGQANFNFIRGIQGVQAYFADTPLMAGNGSASSLSGNSMFFDLESVSVLKGPQGTLFGISTNGGAVLFAPRRPGDRFGGYLSLGLGNDGRRVLEGAVDAPLAAGLKLRVALQANRQDGYVRDQASGQRLGVNDYTTARLVLAFRSGGGLGNELFVNQHVASGALAPFIPVAIKPDGAAAKRIGPGLAGAVEEQQRLGYYRLVGNSLPESNPPGAHYRQTNLANITTLRLGNGLSLKNILGYERLYSFVVSDTDGTPYRILDSNGAGSEPPGTHQLYTEELQLQGTSPEGRLSYTAGLLYTRFQPGAPGRIVSDLRDSFGIQTYASNSSRFQTRAAYAQGNYELGDSIPGLKATAGYRYTDDERGLSKSSGTLLGSGQLLPNAPLELQSRSRSGSYTLSLSYEARPGTLWYLSNSKGFLNGGFNTAVTQAADAPYGPESLNNFELGLKSDQRWGAMQARINLAAYYGLYRDGQVSVTTLVNAGTPQQALGVLTRNAAQGRVRGLEWQLQLVPDRQVQLSFFGSWMSARYTRYQSLDSQGRLVDLSGTPFVFVPRLKYGLSLSAYWPMAAAGGTLSTQLAWTHQDAVFATSTPNPQWYDRIPAVQRLDLSADWDEPMGRKGLQASAFVTNALGNRNGYGNFGAYSSLGILGYAPALPRMLGLNLRQAF